MSPPAGRAVHRGVSSQRELIIDSFAGGGGASTGIEAALGRPPDIAINHDGVALAMHQANHPVTLHLPHNIWKVDPVEVCDGRPVGLLWASPDCKHFSKAKGGRPVEKRIRDLAWVVVRWARQVKPRIIMLENVEEFATWGPLADDGRPCPDRKGRTFKKWVGELRSLGYAVQWRELRACDFGAPTIRRRLFLIARRDGEPIVWPAPTHGDPKSDAVKSGKLLPWRAAAEIIDWSLPCPSIFLDPAKVKALWAASRIRVQRPLKPKTMERIAKGVFRYVINAAEPFIVPITHGGDFRVNGVHEPLRTQTTAHRGEHALVTPFVTKFNNGCVGHPIGEPLHTITAAHSDHHPGGYAPLGIVAPILARTDMHKSNAGCVYPPEDPLRTITSNGGHAVVTPFMVPRYGERPATETGPGQEPRTRSIGEPLPAIVPTDNGAALVAPVLVGCGGRAGQSAPRAADAPLNTATVKEDACLVAAHLSAFYGKGNGGTDRSASAEEPLRTITCDPRHALIAATIVKNNHGDKPHYDIAEPTRTIVAGGNHHMLVSAFLAQHNTDMVGHHAKEPVSTIVQKGCTQAVVSAGLVNLKGTDRRGGTIEAPAPAITAQGGHLAEVRAFLMKYHGSGGQHATPADPMPTIDTRDRIGVVTVHGVEYRIVDIGMRMLTPRERFNAQGFRPDYIIELEVEKTLKSGKTVRRKISGDEQGRMVGNSVSPVIPEALLRANYREHELPPRKASEEFRLEAAE
jgi:DNA (cytosine-5)-methyltransferase 1